MPLIKETEHYVLTTRPDPNAATGAIYVICHKEFDVVEAASTQLHMMLPHIDTLEELTYPTIAQAESDLVE